MSVSVTCSLHHAKKQRNVPLGIYADLFPSTRGYRLVLKIDFMQESHFPSISYHGIMGLKISTIMINKSRVYHPA